MATVLIRQRRSRRNRHVIDPSTRAASTDAVLTFVSAGAGGFVVTSNIPLVLAEEAGLAGAYNHSAGGDENISSITVTSPTSLTFVTPHTAVGGSLTITSAFRGLRTAQGGVVTPGSFH
jgi:hypothetical protein